jgi:hypothetical protein
MVAVDPARCHSFTAPHLKLRVTCMTTVEALRNAAIALLALGILGLMVTYVAMFG